MNFNRILIATILSLACALGVHADELSDLISAVAGYPDASPVNTAAVSSMKHKAADSAGTESDIDPAMAYLEDIAGVMTRNGAFDFILNAMDDSRHSQGNKQRRNTSYRQWTTRSSILTSKGFFRPVPGAVTSNFGWREQFNRMHHGVDLRVNIGDTVRAAISGTVKKVGYDAKGYGNYVVLTHPDGMETLYGHLQFALAYAGQPVQLGMPVGIGGNTGNSTGPHLHFEARLNGVAVDPTMLFNFTAGSYDDEYEKETTDLAEQNKTKSLLPLGSSLGSKRTYIVRQGDTPVTIAQRAGISVMRLCQLNMIRDDEPLQTGRMLKLR